MRKSDGRGVMGVVTLGIIGLVSWLCLLAPAAGIGANWGTQTSHPLPPDKVVQMLKENGFQKVKLFDADDAIMEALKKSGLEVMVGIPNDMLASIASNMKAAQDWVSKNVSAYVNDGVNIRYVAVGNEPFLTTYNGSFLTSTFPALQNIQSSIIKAGLSNQVKVTTPMNADVYESSTMFPSSGDFRADIRDLMLAIIKFLSDNGSAFTVNIYPFISLYSDPNFPVDFAFFDGAGNPINDGGTLYTNVFDANHDTLVRALQKNGFGNLPIIVGEIGWPTDGDPNANLAYARKFNEGALARLLSGKGTPLRPGPIDAYLFSLIDEDEKSIQPGNFERHWGIFYYDGMPKYDITLGQGKTVKLAQVKNIKYLDKKWCVLKSSAKLDDSQLGPSIKYACENADCTSLGYKSSCGGLDLRGNVSYAFNNYYQKNDQDELACKFSGLATTTDTDPTMGTCRFIIMIDLDSAMRWNVLGIRLAFYVLLPYILTFL